MAEMSTDRKIGLARMLSKAGYCSRSRAAELIRAGRVRLNGKLRRDPETPSRLADHITVDGAEVSTPKKLYLMLHKPRGVITTASDEQGRKTVYDYIDPNSGWLAPVGRLDKASEGLLLLTNDSEWSARVLAPETHLPKTYHVQIGKIADETLVNALLHGVDSEGEPLRALKAAILRSGQRNSWLKIILDEGKNRHIRRMLSEMDVEVLRLVRVAIGSLALGNLAKGAHRQLTAAEKKVLDAAMNSNAS